MSFDCHNSCAKSYQVHEYYIFPSLLFIISPANCPFFQTAQILARRTASNGSHHASHCIDQCINASSYVWQFLRYPIPSVLSEHLFLSSCAVHRTWARSPVGCNCFGYKMLDSVFKAIRLPSGVQPSVLFSSLQQRYGCILKTLCVSSYTILTNRTVSRLGYGMFDVYLLP